MNQTKELITVKAVPSLLIKPAGTTDEIIENWKRYLELKSKLLSPSDYQLISGKQYVKKSGWRKLATAFSISDELVEEKKIEINKGFVYEVIVKAISPNGRFAFGVGSCSSTERNFAHPDHDVRSISHTRAKNRAVSDLIGAGEVSANELEASASRPVSYSVTSVVKEPQVKVAATVASNESNGWGREFEMNRITSKQISLLKTLITEAVEDEEERENQLSNLESFSRTDASDLIQEMLDAKKVDNY